MVHAAESMHWYNRDGSPCYTVPAKDGSPRPATVRDARKLSLVPSVTSIIRCAASPGLEFWKTQQAILAALTLPRLPDEPEDLYLKRIMGDSKEQARKAADRGTAIHAAIQGHFEGEIPSESDWPYIKGAMEVLGRWIIAEWIPEKSFSCELGFGGKVDLHTKGYVLDFKTKEFDTTADLKTWDEHAMQLGAYRYGLGMPKAKCAIVYVSSTVPGLAKLIEIPEEDLEQGWTMFYSLLHYWQAKNKYRSSFERSLAA